MRMAAHTSPIVIAHRGASGYRPEHTLEAYRLAIHQGADFIEPDLVATKDGVLVVRHENEISGTTDVAARPEFADRRTTKPVDGASMTGWFTEDFTLAELKTLRAKERIPELRPDNARFDGLYEIPTFAEVVQLAKRESRDGRRIGIYPETKHPTYFAFEGRRLDGSVIGLSLGQMLVDTLVAEDFTDPERVYIQSFEIANLIELHDVVMPRSNVSVPLVQLMGELEFTRPYDVLFNAARGADLAEIYSGLNGVVSSGAQTHYADLASESALAWMKGRYATAIGPWKGSLPVSVSAMEQGTHPLLARALAAGLQVHPYTLRAEEPFLSRTTDGAKRPVLDEARLLLELGVHGFFIDHPDLGVAARNAHEAARRKVL
ncbi:glycerophosphodiester phosphodiesterase [Lysobacter niastensis]|uniref:glycerophosphodiester phosphodiesterase n=2 Tax=Lysobacter niastensis TaxID=380629 RepID=A0ABS0B6L6_9GAMM|nr:glycerophosphodiester phosphodiesterase [Lysobacter niastensis]